MPRPKTYPKHVGVFKSGPDEFSARFKNSDGKRVAYKVGDYDKAVQVQELHSQTARFGVKLPTSAGRGVKFSTIAEDSIVWYEANRKSVGTFTSMVNLAVEKFGNRYAEFIAPQEFEDWLFDLADEQGWSSGSTRNGYRSALITIYREAMSDGKVQDNPARKISRAIVPLGRVRFLSEEEENRLRAAVVTPAHPWDWEEPLWQMGFALNTGMRKAEEFTLTWDQVDFKNRIIHLDKTKNGSDRYVRLNTAALAILTQLKGRKDRLGYSMDSPVFSIKDPSGWFDAAVKRAGIEDVTWHTLRHTFASRLVMLGVNLKTVQVLMGHKSIRMTARYAHLAGDHKKAAVELLVPLWAKEVRLGQ
jgi:integrase